MDMKRAVAFVVGGLLLACTDGGTPTEPPPVVARVVLVGPHAYFYEDTLFVFAAEARTAADARIPDSLVTFTWEVTPSSLATINPYGVLTTTDTGRVTVRVRIGELADSSSFRIGRAPLAPWYTASIRSIYPVLLPGDTTSVWLQVRHLSGSYLFDEVEEWFSETPAIATVNASGRVTALLPGTATISARYRNSTLSTTISILAPSSFASLSSIDVGYQASCGTELTGGGLLCWGNGYNGPTGSSPGSIGVLAGASGFVQAAVGTNLLRCALTPTREALCHDGSSSWSGPGAAYRWMSFDANSFFPPVRGCGVLTDSSAACWWVGDSVSAEAPGLKFVKSRFAELFCGVAADSTAWCWNPGLRQAARLELGVMEVVEISTSGYGTCARTATGDVYCRGDNSSGQLGDGTSTYRLDYVRALGIPPLTAIAAGAGANCGISAVGEVWCLGVTARKLPDLADVVSIRGGTGHHCALRADGAAFCWGNNEVGSLGDGTRMSRTNPTRVRRNY